jgi:hypothetical protein
MKKLIVVLAFMFIPSFADCSQDGVAQWKEMNISYDSGEKIRLSLEIFKLKSLSLTWGGKTIVVPREELEDIALPLIESLYYSFNEFSIEPLKGVQYRVIHLEYGPEMYGEHPEVTFLFYKGRYQERRVRKKISATSWKHEVKKPGKPIEGGGTERVVR